MDPFVRQLVGRLLDPAAPLSRNRHFHTFEDELGRQALKVSRRLRALEDELRQIEAKGGRTRAAFSEVSGRVQVVLELEHLSLRRSAVLEPAEFELLCTLPAARRAFTPPAGA